jgi:hypothetical protein
LTASHENGSKEDEIEAPFHLFAELTDAFVTTDLMPIFSNDAFLILSRSTLVADHVLTRLHVGFKEDE